MLTQKKTKTKIKTMTTPQEALALGDKEKIQTLSGVVQGIYDPEIARGGPFKGKEVQNMYLDAGSDKLKVVLTVPSVFQDTSIKGKTITFESTPGKGGQAAGQLFGVSKSFFNGYHEVRITAKARITVGGSSAPAQGSRPPQAQAPNKQYVPAKKIPFKMYIADFCAMLEEAEEVVKEYGGIKEGMTLANYVGCSPFMSYLRQETLVCVDPEKGKEEEEYAALKGKFEEVAEGELHDFIVSEIIPGLHNKAVRKFCKDHKIGAVDILEAWSINRGVIESDLKQYMKDRFGDSPTPANFIKVVTDNPVEEIARYSEKPEEEYEQDDNEDGWEE
jgi:hypothetical protein